MVVDTLKNIRLHKGLSNNIYLVPQYKVEKNKSSRELLLKCLYCEGY